MANVLWPHLDRFGHARRYLNWNRWFYDGKSLGEICYPVPLPTQAEGAYEISSFVENEAKYPVVDPTFSCGNSTILGTP